MVQKVFDLYTTDDVVVNDFGLKRVISLDSKLVLKSHGRLTDKYAKTKMNIVERLINLVAVPGHRGKKHKVITSHSSGKYSRNASMIMDSLKMIHDKTKQNPIQVLVKAVENAAPRDGTTTIEYGGAKYPQAVDLSPIKRIALALRNMVHGAQDKSFGKKIKMSAALANEIILASQNSNDSVAVSKKNESEKQADSAR
ncbi:MAG: 30S ribosomal protein S7 [Nanoarchaeota archaeon]